MAELRLDRPARERYIPRRQTVTQITTGHAGPSHSSWIRHKRWEVVWSFVVTIVGVLLAAVLTAVITKWQQQPATPAPVPTPRIAEQRYLRGVAHFQAGRYDQAIGDLQAAINAPTAERHGLSISWAHYYFGLALIRTARCDEAELVAQQVLGIDQEVSQRLSNEISRCGP